MDLKLKYVYIVGFMSFVNNEESTLDLMNGLFMIDCLVLALIIVISNLSVKLERKLYRKNMYHYMKLTDHFI